MKRFSSSFFALAALPLAPPASGYLFSDTESERAESNAAELLAEPGMFITPSPGSASRSPCPAINILANHGYIKRSGRDIDAEDLFDALEEVFGTKTSFAKFIFEGAAGRGMEVRTSGNRTLFDIDAIFNYEDAVDFDGSLFYPDRPAPQTNSQELFDQMVEGYCRREDKNSQTCTFQDFTDFTVARLRDSCANTPGAFEPADAKGLGMRYHQVRTGNAFFVFLSLQSNPPEFASLDATAPISDLEDTLIHNRLPDGFVPRATTWDQFVPENAPIAAGLMGRFCAEAAVLGAGGCAVPQCPPPPSASDGEAEGVVADGEAEGAAADEPSETDAEMDRASSIVAAASTGSILAVFWVAASTYLFRRDKRDNGVTEDRSHMFSWTLHVESLRFFALINLLVVLVIGALITEKSGLDTIPDPTETVIFNLFGMNHSCNWIDHNPSRLIAAILVMPLVQVPLMLYTIFWHCRLAKDVKTGKVPRRLLNVSRVFTPFSFFAVSQLHLWFVNTPDDTYGFTAHYIPYLMFQIALCLFQLLNVSYLTFKGDLPWGIPSWVAWAYSSFFAALTVFCFVFVISTIVGDPIISASRGGKEEALANAISMSWVTLGLLGTLILSGKERLNGDVMTLALGDNVLSLESAQKNMQSATFASASSGDEKVEGVDEEDDVLSSMSSSNENVDEGNVGMKNESDIRYRRPSLTTVSLPDPWCLEEIAGASEDEEAHESGDKEVNESKEEEEQESGDEEECKEEEKQEGEDEEEPVMTKDKLDFDGGYGINRSIQKLIDPPTVIDPSTDSGIERDRARHPPASTSLPETATASSAIAIKEDDTGQERVPTASSEKDEVPEESKGGDEVPEGWAEATDPSSGKVYYYNYETRETSWTLPDCCPKCEMLDGAEPPSAEASKVYNQLERGAPTGGPSLVAALRASTATSEWATEATTPGGSRMMNYNVEGGISQAERPGDVESVFFNVWERGAGRIGPLRVPSTSSLSFRDIRSAIRIQHRIDSFQFVLGNSAPLPKDMEWSGFYHKYSSGAIQTGDGTLARPYKIEIAMTSAQTEV